MQSNSKSHRHIKVRDHKNEWLSGYPKSWHPRILRQTRRRLERQDLRMEHELEHNHTDWWMFAALDHDYGQSDYWYHCWLADEVKRLSARSVTSIGDHWPDYW